MSFAEQLLKVKEISGIKQKQAKLRQLSKDRRLRKILWMTYDPFVHFGYTIPESEKGIGDRNLYESDLINIQQGDRLDSSKFSFWAYELYKGIIRKNLRIGIAAKGINAVFPALIRQHDVMLAKRLQWNVLRYPCWATAKLDGLRGIYRDGKMYTRNGRRIHGIDHILDALAGFPYKAVDGELIVLGANFDVGSGKLRAFDMTPEAVYYIIDLPEMNTSFYNRLLRIKGMTEPGDILRMPITQKCRTREAVQQAYEKSIGLGYEGLVIKPLDYKYEAKRSYSWMKMKPEHTLDLRIIGVEEGKGKFEGTLGAIIVQYGANKVRVGTGFSNVFRRYIWDNPEQFIGYNAEVGFMEQTTTGSLRFPVFKRMRRDK